MLLFVLWYCYKRGREERDIREKSELEGEEMSERVEELSDDVSAAPAPLPQSDIPRVVEPIPEPVPNLPHQPEGPEAPK